MIKDSLLNVGNWVIIYFQLPKYTRMGYAVHIIRQCIRIHSDWKEIYNSQQFSPWKNINKFQYVKA